MLHDAIILATCLAMALQHKLQRNLQHVTLALELRSTFLQRLQRFFETVASCSPNVSCNLQWIIVPTLQDKLRGKLHCAPLAQKEGCHVSYRVTSCLQEATVSENRISFEKEN